jgi:competence protein ComEA
MTSSEIRALGHAAVLVLGLGILRATVEGFRSPVMTQGAEAQDSSGLTVLLDESRGSRDEARRRALPLAGDERIDPNTAGEEELDRLPGVGAAVAGRIVQTRRDHGPFAEPADLLSVRGVGPAVLARMTPHLEWPAQPRSERAAPPVFEREAGPSRPAPASDARMPARLDLNRASGEELQTLPGVGPVMAERILTLRRALGRFRRLEELESVRGIGPATIERIRGLVFVGG